jgi:hypothetical protein
MIKQVLMPVTIKTGAFETAAMRSGDTPTIEAFQRREAACKETLDLAEHELDMLLNDGYTVIAQYPTTTPHRDNIVFVLHRRD